MRIAILSRGPQLYSTQKLFQAGRKRGHSMHILDHTRCNLFLEAGRQLIAYEGRPLQPIDAIIPRIGSSVTSLGASVISQFELLGVFTTATAQALLQTRDKLRCLQRLAGRGVAMPKTVFLADHEPAWSVVEAVGGLPVVIKVLESTHGVGVMLARTHRRMAGIVHGMREVGQRIMVQEFIREAAGADIRALVVGEEVVAVMRRQARAGDFRSNLHQGGKAFPDQLSEAEEAMVLQAVRAVGLHIAGVDLLRSRRGPLIMEVNASPGLEGIEGTTGVDVAARILQFVEQHGGPAPAGSS